MVVAYLHPGEVAGAFASSLTGLLIHDSSHGRRIIGNRGGGVIDLSSGPRVAEGRSQLCDSYLLDPRFIGADHLLMLDSDMTFGADMLDLLLETSRDNDADVVGGLCFAGGRSRMFPTLYKVGRTEKGEIDVDPIIDYPRDTVVKVGATGAACLLIRRRILLAMMAPHDQGGFGTLEDGTPNAYPWFVEGHMMAGSKPLGEDIAFCVRVNGMGGTVLVDTRVKLGHVKTLELTEDLWDELRASQTVNDPPVAPAVDEDGARAHAAASVEKV